jgi:hypothetical protein
VVSIGTGWRAYDTLSLLALSWQGAAISAATLIACEWAGGWAAEELGRHRMHGWAALCCLLVGLCGVGEVWLAGLQTQMSSDREQKHVSEEKPPPECGVTAAAQVDPKTVYGYSANKTDGIMDRVGKENDKARGQAAEACQRWTDAHNLRMDLAKKRPDGLDYLLELMQFLGAVVSAFLLPVLGRLVARRRP